MSDLKIYSFGEWKLFDYGAICAISRNDEIPCLILSHENIDQLTKCLNSRALDHKYTEAKEVS